jgi:hypothetical protein
MQRAYHLCPVLINNYYKERYAPVSDQKIKPLTKKDFSLSRSVSLTA